MQWWLVGWEGPLETNVCVCGVVQVIRVAVMSVMGERVVCDIDEPNWLAASLSWRVAGVQ